MHVAPVLLDFLAGHPGVSARSFFVDRIVNLHDEGFDVAVRIAHLPDSGLTAVRVGAVRRVVVASPDYLAAHGTRGRRPNWHVTTPSGSRRPVGRARPGRSTHPGASNAPTAN
jgi:DNA-binding transcriptional LysR family regulator